MQRIGSLAAALLVAGCGDGETLNMPNGGAPVEVGTADASANAALATPAPAPRASPSATPGAAAQEDVTAAGFPFKAGYYILKGTCAKGNFNVYEFAKTYRHQYEADQNQEFARIVRLGPGRYRITEKIAADDMVDGSTETYVYEATGPDSFKSDEPVNDDDDQGNAHVRKGATMTFRYCPRTSLGIDSS